LAVLVAPIVIPAGLLLSGISDGSPPVADTSVPNNDVAGSVKQTGLNSYLLFRLKDLDLL
jgi:hypothetical protein